jgi:hypothetical protein
MRKTNIIAFAITLLAVAAITPGLQVFAQAPAPAQPEMSEEKRAHYAKYYAKNKGTPEEQKEAYQLGQEFVQKYGADDDTYVKAVKRWMGKYEAAKDMWDFEAAMKQKDYARSFELGQKMLAREPENFKVIINLASAGQQSAIAGNTSFNAQALNYAKQAAQLLETNKVTDFAGMNPADALGFSYFVQGVLQAKDAPKEAAVVLTKAAKTTGAYKDDPSTFYLLGTSIMGGEYQAKAEEYTKLYGDKPETPESKTMRDQVMAIADKGVNVLARAVALATKPEHAALKAQVMIQLTEMYKDLHQGSADGLDALIASALSKPLP